MERQYLTKNCPVGVEYEKIKVRAAPVFGQTAYVAVFGSGQRSLKFTILIQQVTSNYRYSKFVIYRLLELTRNKLSELLNWNIVFAKKTKKKLATKEDKTLQKQKITMTNIPQIDKDDYVAGPAGLCEGNVF